MNNKNYFVTGIGTGIGKTIVSAVLCEALSLDYWKPVQAGNLERTDSNVVQELLSNPDLKVHFEKYRLETPCSVHLAARLDNIKIKATDFTLPNTNNGLIAEGAGGLLVPINEDETVLDIISHLSIPVIVISKNYLGSINHTMLTIDKLLKSSSSILGVVFNGEENRESEKIIKSMTGVKLLAHINTLNELTKESIKNEAERIRKELDGTL